MFAKAVIPAQDGLVVIISLSAGEVEELSKEEIIEEDDGQPLPAIEKLGNRVIQQITYINKGKTRARRPRQARSNGVSDDVHGLEEQIEDDE